MGQVYDREAAVAYANRYWQTPNPAYKKFAVDCTNFVSQSLFAGGAPMNYTGKRETGWWYEGYSGRTEKWSFSWAVSHSLMLYLQRADSRLRAEEVKQEEALTAGDVIFYDWKGDGRVQHSVIVTATSSDGPLVNAHSAASYRRPWAYRDSPAWRDSTRYFFFQIADHFSY